MKTTRPDERVAYFNGKILPESQVLIFFRDRGFKYGDAVFDVSRTFGGKIFRLKEHVDRLYRSLKYARIDPGLTPRQMIEITQEILERNLSLLGPDEDYWVAQRISRGVDVVGGEARARDPNAWAVLLDTNGNLSEGIGSNVFIVEHGRLHTPKSEYVLPGVSRQTVMELAEEVGMACKSATAGCPGR